MESCLEPLAGEEGGEPVLLLSSGVNLEGVAVGLDSFSCPVTNTRAAAVALASPEGDPQVQTPANARTEKPRVDHSRRKRMLRPGCSLFRSGSFSPPLA